MKNSTYIYKTFVLFWSCLLLSLGSLIGQSSTVKLYGYANDTEVKLYWEPHAWADTLRGFQVKKRKEGDSWELLSPKPIVPYFDKNKDWRNQGLDEKQIEDIKKTYDTYVQQGDVHDISEKQVFDALLEANGFLSGDRIRLKTDYNFAVLLGLAYSENVKHGEKYEYGVFAVDQGGKVASVPIATWQAESKKEFTIDSKLRKDKTNLELAWSISEKKFTSACLWGFDLYRKSPEIETWQKLNRSSLSYKDKKGGSINWRYLDTTVNTNIKYQYKLVAINTFQAEVEKVVVKYKPKAYKTNDWSLVIDTIMHAQYVHLKIQWQASKGVTKSIVEQVVLERSPIRNVKFKAVNTDLKGKNYWIDSSKLDYGTQYYYRLYYTDQHDLTTYSPVYKMQYLGTPIPSVPTHVKASFKTIKQKPYVVLSWDYTDTITSSYQILSDELEMGVYRRITQVPFSKSNTYMQSISGLGGREVGFRIIPEHKHGHIGEAAEVRVEIPKQRLPAITSFEVTLKDDQLIFHWTYATDITGIDFTILVNDTLLVSKKEIESKDRIYKLALAKLPKDQVHIFQLQASTTYAAVKSITRSLYLPQKDVALVAPKHFKTEWVEDEDGQQSIYCSWEEVNLVVENLKGYYLYIDDQEEGKLRKTVELGLLKGNEVKIVVADLSRNYTVGIAAISTSYDMSKVIQKKLKPGK